MNLAATGSNIFQTKLLNPAANRFMLARANNQQSKIENQKCEIWFYKNEPAILHFMAVKGETLHIEFDGGTYDFTFAYDALYLLNISNIRARYPDADNFITSFNGGAIVNCQLSIVNSSWPVRTFLFRNHYAVYEPFTTTGRAQRNITRPENTAQRYIPSIDDFKTIDHPSTPVQTLSLSAGYQNP